MQCRAVALVAQLLVCVRLKEMVGKGRSGFVMEKSGQLASSMSCQTLVAPDWPSSSLAWHARPVEGARVEVLGFTLCRLQTRVSMATASRNSCWSAVKKMRSRLVSDAEEDGA